MKNFFIKKIIDAQIEFKRNFSINLKKYISLYRSSSMSKVRKALFVSGN